MLVNRLWIVIVVIALGGGRAWARDVYVATDGAPDHPGTIRQPLASIQRAVDEAKAGDVIHLRGGIYRLERPLIIWNKHGTAEQPITLQSHPGERAILDWAALTRKGWDGDQGGISIGRSEYWIIRDLELRHSPRAGLKVMNVGARHNRFEDIETHHNYLSGIACTGRDNTFVRIRAHHNADLAHGGGNADGIHLARFPSGEGGGGNTFIDCVAYLNSDDGFDAWDSEAGNVFRNCRAWRNGYIEKPDGELEAMGDGNGFKLGGTAKGDAKTGGHQVVRSMAYLNRTRGFDSNNADLPLTLYHNTAWNNGGVSYRMDRAAHILKNNIAVGTGMRIDNLAVQSHNGWNLGIDAPGFVSVDPQSTKFLHLKVDAPAVDPGVDLGLPHPRAAPDQRA
ncbi:MAG: right-handed parallel beta-helix repeat-containing protein, partial [Phycisphaeraceae bacterium]